MNETAQQLKGMIEAAGALLCSECEHPLRYHADKHGCEWERGDGYPNGSEYLQALGPCSCKGGTDEERTVIAALRTSREVL